MSKSKVSRASAVLSLTLLLAPALAFAEVVGHGTVVDVNWPGQGDVRELDVADRDAVSGGHEAYTPGQATRWVKAGEKYNLILVTQPKSRAQLFVVFWGTGREHPALEKTLASIDTTVQGVGAGDRPIHEGDTVEISTQPAKSGGVDVTLDVFRERAAVATFSFVQGN